MARQLADEETNLPLIAQGEMGLHTTKTSLVLSSDEQFNIALRKAVKNWDDDIIRPLITRFYDWNMQYNEKPESKAISALRPEDWRFVCAREAAREFNDLLEPIYGYPRVRAGRDWQSWIEDSEIARSAV